MSGLVAFSASLLLTPLVLVMLRRWGVLDHPNARSSHDIPVVRGGGLAFAVACLLAVVLTVDGVGPSQRAFGIVAAATVLGSIGLLEDLRGVRPLPRFILQFSGSAIACAWLLRGLEGPLLWQLVFAGGAVLWLVAYINGFNFMDGINGISAVQSTIAGGTWAWLGHAQGVDTLTWGGLILVGASLGFLPFNFPRAKLFPGDAGSYFIGGWQGALLVIGFRSGLPVEAVLAPLAIYLADTSTTLIRRVIAGERWHEPHREHTYQLLIRQGWSHVRTTALVGAFVATCAGLGLLSITEPWARIAADGLLVALLVAYLLLPRWVGRTSRSLRVA